MSSGGMDRFYKENAGLYRRLVSAVDTSVPEVHFSRNQSYKVVPAQEKQPAYEASSDMLVTARVRPMLEEDISAGFPCAVHARPSRDDGNAVADLHDLYNHPRGRPVLKSSKYEVDQLFNMEATTDLIYEKAVEQLVAHATSGAVGTLFAYGQTGSGKTFTISHLQKSVTRSLLDPDQSNETQIHMTIIDLAGNAAFDLLSSRKPISILENSSGEFQLAGAVEVNVQTGKDAFELIDQAASFRRTASTLKNDASSRSHAICRIRISTSTSRPDGLLYLVDLAGSEAARDVAVHGAERMREAREINMSLSVLKDCIRGKAEAQALGAKGKKNRVPYRQSALTKVLKHVFDPDGTRPSKTVVIACVNPNLADVGSSKNTLRYAEMLRVRVEKKV